VQAHAAASHQVDLKTQTQPQTQPRILHCQCRLFQHQWWNFYPSVWWTLSPLEYSVRVPPPRRKGERHQLHLWQGWQWHLGSAGLPALPAQEQRARAVKLGLHL